MYIKEVEIDNFKSFANKLTIPFLKGFTTISGPNGSGKSRLAAVLAGMAALMVAVNDRASRVEMPMPDNSLGIYRTTPAAGN